MCIESREKEMYRFPKILTYSSAKAAGVVQFPLSGRML